MSLDNMTDRPGDNVAIILVVFVFLGDFAEGARDVGGDARFFGDDEGFGHEGMPTRPRWRGLQVPDAARTVRATTIL